MAAINSTHLYISLSARIKKV